MIMLRAEKTFTLQSLALGQQPTGLPRNAPINRDLVTQKQGVMCPYITPHPPDDNHFSLATITLRASQRYRDKMGRTTERFKSLFHRRSQSSLQPTPSPAAASTTALQSSSGQGSVPTPRPVSAAGNLQTPSHSPSLLGNNTAYTQTVVPSSLTVSPTVGQAGRTQSIVGHGVLPLPGSIPFITVNGPPGSPQTAQQPGGINTHTLNQVATQKLYLLYLNVHLLIFR